jgi:hypothetical protein
MPGFPEGYSPSDFPNGLNGLKLMIVIEYLLILDAVS